MSDRIGPLFDSADDDPWFRPGMDRDAFAASLLDYVRTNPDFETWDCDQAILEAVRVLTNDIGAAQAFLVAIGVEVDLYAE